MSIADKIINLITQRPPNFVIGGHDNPYLRRWYVIPRNRFFNIYLHQFLRSDDDRALHDHPWMNASILLRGTYIEHTIAAGGCHVQTQRTAGDVKVRLSGKHAHRLELVGKECWTIFLTGPKYRHWYFHCPQQGMVHWEDFTSKSDIGQVGKGCDQ